MASTRTTNRAYDDWECPVCGTLNDAERTDCTDCEYTTEPAEAGRSRMTRWATAAVLGALAIAGGLTVLVVGVQTVDSSMVPVPVLTGLGIATVGMNLAVDSLDW